MPENTIYTIGHSTHDWRGFVALLKMHGIGLLADIRRYPGSRKYPQYQKENMIDLLAKEKIGYVHLAGLGGRRKPDPGSINMRWRKEAFRGYADYMQSTTFKEELKTLENLAPGETTAMMCAEGLWWRCHRSLVADKLKASGRTVLHIMPDGRLQPHPYTGAARIVDGAVVYYD